MALAAIIILCIILVLLLALLFASFYFFRVAIVRQPKGFLSASPDLPLDQYGVLIERNMVWFDQQPFEKLEMASHDGLLLRGYYLAAKAPTPKTAILAHGYMGNARKDMAGVAKLYHEIFGYNVLMPDDRGHGESEGRYIGFGWLDRLDYVKWIYFVLNKVGQEAQIVLHGISMGGATVLMTSGEELPEQVRCVISDCAYTSVKDILTHQARQLYKLPTFPLLSIISLICKLRAGYFFGEASTLAQVKKAHLPTLFIHGGEDLFVPTTMLNPLYEASTAPKEKFIVPTAGHGLAYAVDVAGYRQQVRDFLQKFMQ
jgi:fermentation-respiration switch protein FrsA (DUF1100 family)